MMDGINNGMSAGGWLLMSVFWVALIVLIVWVAATVFPRGMNDSVSERPDDRPENILDRRLAAGEIDAAAYDALRRKLRDGRTGRAWSR